MPLIGFGNLRPAFAGHVAARRLATAGLILILCSRAGLAGGWIQFGGPGGLGVSDEKGFPVKWSSTENIAWKAELPGPGASSPIALGDRVFLTCYSGYGLERNVGEQKDLRRHLLCFERKNGQIKWSKVFE